MALNDEKHDFQVKVTFRPDSLTRLDTSCQIYFGHNSKASCSRKAEVHSKQCQVTMTFQMNELDAVCVYFLYLQ